MDQIPLNTPGLSGTEKQQAAASQACAQPLPVATSSLTAAEMLSPHDMTAAATELPFGGKPGMILLLAGLFILVGLMLGEVLVRLLTSLFGPT